MSIEELRKVYADAYNKKHRGIVPPVISDSGLLAVDSAATKELRKENERLKKAHSLISVSLRLTSEANAALAVERETEIKELRRTITKALDELVGCPVPQAVAARLIMDAALTPKAQEGDGEYGQPNIQRKRRRKGSASFCFKTGV